MIRIVDKKFYKDLDILKRQKSTIEKVETILKDAKKP